jgi:prevent-host-death family protein
MKQMQMRDAKAQFSEMIDGVQKGEPVTLTKHGTEVAMVVPIEDGRKLYPEKPRPRKSLVDLLREFPGGDDLDLERDRTPPREIDL